MSKSAAKLSASEAQGQIWQKKEFFDENSWAISEGYFSKFHIFYNQEIFAMVAVATATAGHVGVSSRTALSVCPVDMCGCVRLLNQLRTRPSETFSCQICGVYAKTEIRV